MTEQNETETTNVRQRKKATFALMVLELALKIAMFTLGVYIFKSHAAHKSVAYSHGEWNRYMNYILIGIFNMIFSVLFTWLKYPFVGEMVFFTDFVSVIFVAFDVSVEVTVYRELACFNQDSGSIVTTRSILVFIYVITVYASLILSCYTVFKECARFLMALLFVLFMMMMKWLKSRSYLIFAYTLITSDQNNKIFFSLVQIWCKLCLEQF